MWQVKGKTPQDRWKKSKKVVTSVTISIPFEMYWSKWCFTNLLFIFLELNNGKEIEKYLQMPVFGLHNSFLVVVICSAIIHSKWLKCRKKVHSLLKIISCFQRHGKIKEMRGANIFLGRKRRKKLEKTNGYTIGEYVSDT